MFGAIISRNERFWGVPESPPTEDAGELTRRRPDGTCSADAKPHISSVLDQQPGPPPPHQPPEPQQSQQFHPQLGFGLKIPTLKEIKLPIVKFCGKEEYPGF
ncbi:hypothetical protein PF008_g27498 [Phytophthora fragariae]|uniref:Uncharacterized protein n=1 Tax=Phytophthora fragariae TaxID=53985 RepID=A0A6G0QEK9_9STRA|nr:hypothetical protein PF008_g27498 [Phytophthora fragariae]